MFNPKTRSLRDPVDFEFVQKYFTDKPNQKVIHLIINAAQQQGVKLCNQVAYILATAKNECEFTLKDEEFAYDIYNLQAKWGKTKFSDAWIAQNLTFTKNSRGKSVVATKDWSKVANRAYANVNGNGDEASGDGFKYRGRGFVQPTGRSKYEEMGKLLGLDLVNNPDLALNQEVATKILVCGMKYGMFTGKKLDDYLSLASEDYFNARRIVNGLDKAGLFGSYAESYEKILSRFGTFFYDTPNQDYLLLNDKDNFLYAGAGPKAREGAGDYFDGGEGNDFISFAGTAGNWPVPEDEFHPGAQYGCIINIGGATPSIGRVLPDLRDFPISNHGIYNFENVIGSEYNDIIIGGTGANDLYGNKGDDFIFGYGGGDVLAGGPGRDTFIYYETKDSPNNSQHDVITDFNPKEDKINLFYIDADHRYFSNEEFKFIGKVSSPNDIRGGQLGYVLSSNSTLIYANINQNNNKPQDDLLCEILISLNGSLELSKSCFVL